MSKKAALRRTHNATTAPTLHSIRAVAARTSMSEVAVRRLCWKGELRYVRIGHSIRISEADLAAYIAANSSGCAVIGDPA